MRTERRQVSIDLKLPSNDILLFTGDSVVVTERSLVQGLGDMTRSPFAEKSSPFVKRSQRYDLSKIMNNSKGVLASPAVQRNN